MHKLFANFVFNIDFIKMSVYAKRETIRKAVILHDDEYYRSRIPEPDLGALKNFMRFVWNPDRRTLLGRSGKEWALLFFFYTCFFSVLGSLFALQMWISIQYASTLDKPFFIYEGLAPRSYFSSNFPAFRRDFNSPGISFQPNILLPKTSRMIWVDSSNVNVRPKTYVQILNDFLREYNKSKDNYKTVAECSETPVTPSVKSMKPCFFDVESLGVCGKPPYGYTSPLQPCVLIKFNKRFNWVPFHYNKSFELPGNMPHALQDAVRSSNKSQIWLWCDGASNVDKEHIGEIEYLPSPGFPVQYFPFMGQPNYLSPMVALRFKNITPFKLVKVVCSLWARNINGNSQKALDFRIILNES